MMWSLTPEPSSKSPSVETMQREQVSPRRRWRINSQIRAADADAGAVGHQRDGILQRHHLLAQTAIALRHALAQPIVGFDLTFTHLPHSCRPPVSS